MAPEESAFPQYLPPRPDRKRSFRERHCPGMRTCWIFSYSAFSLRTTDKAVLARRICMLLILAERTVLSVLNIMRGGYGGLIPTLVVGPILGILGFLAISWCLAAIGEARGVRKVMSVYIGKWHFDVFLLVMALLHSALLIGFSYHFVGPNLSVIWLVLWLLIFAAAWISTWSPEIMEDPPSNV